MVAPEQRHTELEPVADAVEDEPAVPDVPAVVVALFVLFEAVTGVASRLHPSAASVTPSP